MSFSRPRWPKFMANNLKKVGLVRVVAVAEHDLAAELVSVADRERLTTRQFTT